MSEARGLRSGPVVALQRHPDGTLAALVKVCRGDAVIVAEWMGRDNHAAPSHGT